MSNKAKKSKKKQQKNATTSQTTKPIEPTTSALTVVVERVNDDTGTTPVPPKQRPAKAKDYPGNQRFVMGRNARTLTELAVVDRIAGAKLCEAPILPEPTSRTDLQVRITAMLMRELERLYADRERTTEAKDHLRKLYGVAIEAVGAACMY